MTTTTAKKLHATRDFTDSGTGKSFKAGEPINATKGELANYQAAGLAGDKPAQASAQADADQPA